MKKKIGYLLVLAFFVTTAHPINWSDWSPVSIWKARNLSSDKKAIRSIIKNCTNTSLDSKFNLELFLEKEQPRTVYEWIKVLKINSFLIDARKNFKRIQDSSEDSFDMPTEGRGSRVTSNKRGALAFWQDKINYALNQRSFLEPRLSFLPSVNFAIVDHNFIPPACADNILTNLEKTFPYLTTNTPVSSPLPADQISVILQLLSSLPASQQNQIKTILEKNPTTVVFALFELWGKNSNPAQNDSKDALIDKITEAAWQSSPDSLSLQAKIANKNAAKKDFDSCWESVRAHDLLNCNAEEASMKEAEEKVQKALAVCNQNETSFKQQFQQLFATNPARLIALPSSLAQTATRYLQSYYPGLS